MCINQQHTDCIAAWHTTAFTPVHPTTTLSPNALPLIAPVAPLDIDLPSTPPVAFDDSFPIAPKQHNIPIAILGLSPHAAHLRVHWVSTLAMADSGSNVCITPDQSILMYVEPIDPIPLGVAITNAPHHTSLCTEQGYLCWNSPKWLRKERTVAPTTARHLCLPRTYHPDA